MYIPHLYPFLCQWTSRLLPCPSYCKYCGSEHWGTCVFFYYGFLRVYGGVGNGNPLQYSCLENPMDGGAWWATVHGVARSWTRPGDFTFTLEYMEGRVLMSWRQRQKGRESCLDLGERTQVPTPWLGDGAGDVQTDGNGNAVQAVSICAYLMDGYYEYTAASFWSFSIYSLTPMWELTDVEKTAWMCTKDISHSPGLKVSSPRQTPSSTD